MSISNFQSASESELTRRLRRCGTKGDPEIRPYQNVDIRLETVQLTQVRPLAKYLLQQQLDVVAKLQQDLKGLAVDMFNLRDGIIWPYGATASPLSAPIIEFWPDEGFLLVDGLHRVWSAREQGRKEVYCVVLRGVKIPLVPLPVAWEDITLFPLGGLPNENEKRVYRFSGPESLRSAIPEVAERVTGANYRYFLYRDLKELGSSGIRAR